MRITTPHSGSCGLAVPVCLPGPLNLSLVFMKSKASRTFALRLGDASCLVSATSKESDLADVRRTGKQRGVEHGEAAAAGAVEDERTVRFPCHAAGYDPAWLVPYTLQVCSEGRNTCISLAALRSWQSKGPVLYTLVPRQITFCHDGGNACCHTIRSGASRRVGSGSGSGSGPGPGSGSWSGSGSGLR